ncbi:MAG TPA: hypothetical protein VK446_13275 [Methylocystis sp.]|nr:hypothetical protein [Methylocystis sp.]
MSPAKSFAVLLSATLSLAACNAPSLSSPPPPVVAAPAAPEPVPPGVLGGAIGRELDEKDRTLAIAAQNEAVNSGQQKSWRGAHTAYGFITPGPESGNCRDYTHKIFINGRPQEAKGQACRKGDVWRVTS